MKIKSRLDEERRVGAPRILDENLFSSKELVDYRCQGYSFDQMVEHYNHMLEKSAAFKERAGNIKFTKIMIYGLYQKMKARNFDGYVPEYVNMERLDTLLKDKSLTLSEVAQRIGLNQRGLLFFMEDRGIDRKIRIPTVKRFRAEGRSIDWICDFYGISRPTFMEKMKKAGVDLFENGKAKPRLR